MEIVSKEAKFAIWALCKGVNEAKCSTITDFGVNFKGLESLLVAYIYSKTVLDSVLSSVPLSP